MILYFGLLLFRLLGRLLPVPVLAGAGRVLAGKRASIRKNFRTILAASPGAASGTLDGRARKLAWRSMLAYGEHLLDFAWLSQLLPKVYADTLHARGWEHIDRALAEGRGAVFVTAHFGKWDLAGAAQAKHCPPGSIYAVAEPFAHGRLDDVVTQERESYGLGIVPMENVRQMARVLREGKVLGIVAPVSTREWQRSQGAG